MTLSTLFYSSNEKCITFLNEKWNKVALTRLDKTIENAT